MQACLLIALLSNITARQVHLLAAPVACCSSAADAHADHGRLCMQGLAGPARGVGGPAPGMMAPRPQMQAPPQMRPPGGPMPGMPPGVRPGGELLQACNRVVPESCEGIQLLLACV